MREPIHHQVTEDGNGTRRHFMACSDGTLWKLVETKEATVPWQQVGGPIPGTRADRLGQGEPTDGAGPDEVLDAVAGVTGVDPEQMRGARRTAEIVRARHLAMYLLREHLGWTYTRIGQELGDRDHTTAIHAVEKVRGENGRMEGALSAIRATLSTPVEK